VGHLGDTSPVDLAWYCLHIREAGLTTEPRGARQYTVLGILAILFWSTSIGFGRTLTEQVGTVRAAAWICLLGGVVSCAICGWRMSVLEDLRLLGAKHLFICGGLFSAYMICLYTAVGLSVDRSQVVGVGLINYLWPALTLILAVPLLHRRVRFPRLVLGMSLAVLGTYLAAVDPPPRILFAGIAELLAPPDSLPPGAIGGYTMGVLFKSQPAVGGK
jgi:drug/metabolite transporter (DMT)-like permease